MDTISVAGLWRYPVKSMSGEPLAECALGSAGLLGDRAYALVNGENQVGSAKLIKRFGGLLHWQARFRSPPTAGHKPPVRLAHSDGREIDSDAGDAAIKVAEAFGAQVTLHDRPPPGLKLAFAPGTLGGKHTQTTEVPVSSAAPDGTFFDLAPVMIIAGATLRELGGSEGSQACVARLRPNIVLEEGAAAAFAENSWVGKRIAIGPQAVITVTLPCPRCAIPTLSQATLPADRGFLRRVAQANTCDLGDFGRLPCAGAYAAVTVPGPIRQGDAVRFLDA